MYKLILLIEKNILKHNKDQNIHISMLEMSTFKLHHYNIMTKLLIFMRYFATLDISNLIIKLLQKSRLICTMDKIQSTRDKN